MIQGKECDQPEKLELGPPEKRGMRNDERDENSPVETIDERLKRLCKNEIDGRKSLRLREEDGGRAGKQRQLGRENRRIS